MPLPRPRPADVTSISLLGRCISRPGGVWRPQNRCLEIRFISRWNAGPIRAGASGSPPRNDVLLTLEARGQAWKEPVFHGVPCPVTVDATSRTFRSSERRSINGIPELEQRGSACVASGGEPRGPCAFLL